MSSKQSSKEVHASYVTLNKDGKAVWEPGLKAEITSRRQHRVKRKIDEVDETPVSCDLKATLKLTPDARAAWLEKALGAIPKGKAKTQEVFDIITHRKFTSGVPEELGHSMLRQVKESVFLFSEKQQLTIAKSRLVKDFKPIDQQKKGSRRRHEDDDSSDDGSVDEDIAHRPTRGEEDASAPSRPQPPSSAPPQQEAASGSGKSKEAEQREQRDPEQREERERERERERELSLPQLSPEERAKIEREQVVREAERQRKREKELKKLEEERKAHEERERQRKAKIGSAFLMGGEDEDDDSRPLGGRILAVEKRREPAIRPLNEEPLGGGLLLAASSSTTSNAPGTAIRTMGGDSLVAEAQQILQQTAGAFLAKQERERKEKPPPSRSKSRSRSRSRRKTRRRSPSSSPSRHGRGGGSRGGPGGGGPGGGASDHRRSRTYDSLRSPTPDGHLRGQMRAARKAKLMAQMLQQGNVPRVS